MSAQTPRYWFPKPYADRVQRLRVAAGILLLVTFGWFSNPSKTSLERGLPLCILGLLIRGWAAGHLAKNEQLAMSGPYAWVRNPLYLGTLLTAIGITVASRSVLLAIVAAVVFLFVYLPVIELEEQHLRSLFPYYAQYAHSVRRLLPFHRFTTTPKRFRWSLYMRNEEWKAALGFALALAWMIFRAWRRTL